MKFRVENVAASVWGPATATHGQSLMPHLENGNFVRLRVAYAIWSKTINTSAAESLDALHPGLRNWLFFGWRLR